MRTIFPNTKWKYGLLDNTKYFKTIYYFSIIKQTVHRLGAFQCLFNYMKTLSVNIYILNEPFVGVHSKGNISLQLMIHR